jgi:UDP-N-acetylmuramate: L-alanyl-gamma-D-glutamyl-meso-diaminopimelate ligase
LKVHLIGICGTGMGALAGLLKAAGHDVRGSDSHPYPPMSDQLRALGVPIFEGFAAENLDWGPEEVVVGNVNRKDHVEVVAAQARGIKLASMPSALGEHFLAGDRHNVVVAGTHGKTTTTSLLAWVLHDAGRDPSFLVGGVPANLGQGYRVGGGPHFVIEGDEYDSAFFDKGSKFLHYRPRTAILTSIELDHVDIFASLDEVKAAFAKFVALLPEDGLLLVAASSEQALAVAETTKARRETYAAGKRAQGDWHGEILATERGRTRFRVVRGAEEVGEFDLGLTGEHNVENAVAVIAAATHLGLTPGEIARGMARFRGVKRRQELRGVASGVEVIDDYGHHPTAIKETLAGLRKASGKLVALYEPRSATSRRSIFQNEFADALALADTVIVGKLFAPDGIPPEQRFDPERLVGDLRARGVSARYVTDVDEIAKLTAEEVAPGDRVVVFSSGAFGGVHEKLLDTLGDPMVPARPEDMPRAREILELTGLGAKDLADDRWPDVILVRSEGEIVGCVMLEVFDDAAILRSLAVVPDSRGHGFGWMLADHATVRARERGARRLYLLTESASDFFGEKLGFRQIDRATVDPAVAAAPHFRDSARSAVAMRLDL